MTTGETLILLVLVIIAYFLYHIAKQLSYLTGKRMKISLFSLHRHFLRQNKQQFVKKERLPN